MGILCEGLAFMHGDNQLALCNATVPDSTLKKKYQSIASHFVIEGVASDEWRTACVSTDENESYLLTKTLPNR